MTYTVKFADVTRAISNIAVSGVTVKDITAIPEQAMMICPIMFPSPDFVSNFVPTVETLGTAGTEKITLDYDITYIYAHSTINGGLGGVLAAYSGLITKITAIIVSILTNDNPRDGTTLRLRTISKAGVVNDLAGNAYWGCMFTFHVQEFCEVP